MKWKHHFYDIPPTIFYIVLTLFLSPHPLYWWYHTTSIYEISSSIYVDIVSIVYNNIFTIFFPSQPMYLCLTPTLPWYHTVCIHDFAPTICLTSGTLYKVSHPQFMITCHIIYDFKCIVFMSSLPRYLTLHPQNLCAHNHSLVVSLNYCMYDITPTLYMTSYSPHITSHTLFEFTPL